MFFVFFLYYCILTSIILVKYRLLKNNKIFDSMKNNIKNYLIAVLWFILSLISSSLNDILAKGLGDRLGSLQIAFLRFFFSTLVLIPLYFTKYRNDFRTSYLYIHVIRGILLFLGIICWIFGLHFVPVSTATILSFAVPLFTLVLASFFLKEKVIWQRWIATIFGFCGVFIIIQPHSNEFRAETLIFVAASLAFATLDVINKKFIVKESMLSMMFYSSLVTTLLALGPGLYYWQTPSFNEFSLLIILGASANLILYFLLKAFSLADATALAPYRYFELIISASLAYLFFAEKPETNALLGSLLLIPSTLFVVYSEQKNLRYNQEIKESTENNQSKNAQL